MCCAAEYVLNVESIMGAVRKALSEKGIDFETLCECRAPEGETADQPKVKVVCVAPTLRESVEELSGSARDQVVMVRVDAETAGKLDAWMETEAVKSRSEAAALFIREGLKVRASELERLRGALGEVHAARDRLRRQARGAFGLGPDTPAPEA